MSKGHRGAGVAGEQEGARALYHPYVLLQQGEAGIYTMSRSGAKLRLRFTILKKYINKKLTLLEENQQLILCMRL